MTHESDMTEPFDDALALRLSGARPAPPTAYRAALHRVLMALGPPETRPARLWRLAGAHAAGGLVLLAVAVVSIAGIGPLAS
jgi:hypothetical protein